MMLCGWTPFQTANDQPEQQIFANILSGQFSFPSPEWDEIPDECKDFVKQILVLDVSIAHTFPVHFFSLFSFPLATLLSRTRISHDIFGRLRLQLRQPRFPSTLPLPLLLSSFFSSSPSTQPSTRPSARQLQKHTWLAPSQAQTRRVPSNIHGNTFDRLKDFQSKNSRKVISRKNTAEAVQSKS